MLLQPLDPLVVLDVQPTLQQPQHQLHQLIHLPSAPSSALCQVAMKHRHFADGLKTLAGSLGLRNGLVGQKRCTNPETEEVYEGFRVTFSGDMWDVMQYCALTYKQCPRPGQPNYVAKSKDSRCYGFTITALPVSNYHGFAVHGGANRRLLLEDFTVTHNVIPSLHAHQPTHSRSLLTAFTISPLSDRPRPRPLPPPRPPPVPRRRHQRHLHHRGLRVPAQTPGPGRRR